jgi:hypothetical protein
MPRINNTGILVWGIPNAFDLPRILENHPPRGFKPILDHFYHIMDYLCNQVEFQDLDENDAYVNLNAHKLQRYNKHYWRYLEYYESNGILRSDNHFIKWEKSRGYRIAPAYLSKSKQEIPVQRITLKRKLYQDLQQRRLERAQTVDQYHYLTKWFNSNLQIDALAARGEAKKIYKIKNLEGTVRGKIKGWGKIKFKRFKAYQSIERISNKDFYYSVDNTVGRFHSNLTNLKKDLRKYLTYEGKPLAIVDIANAQPLFSALLLKKEFYMGETELNWKKIVSLSSNLYSTSQLHKLTTSLLTYITLQLSSERQAQSSFQEYLESVQAGTFYEIAHQKMFPGQHFNKKKVKEAVFITFFSDNHFIGQWDAQPKKLFAQTYPDVYWLFKRIKRGNHALLALLLQRIESYIIVETVARRIATERPELPIYTIHDGIATLKGEEHYVKRIMQEEILRLTGLSCTIALEG